MMRNSSGLGWASTMTGELMAPWGGGKPPGSLCGGRWCPRSPVQQWGAIQLKLFLFFSLPFYSFFRRLALELPCLSLLELGRPLAWCGGTSWSISSVEVGGGILTHCWAVLCNRSMPCSDPSVCKITARADATLCLSFLGINSLVTE